MRASRWDFYRNQSVPEVPAKLPVRCNECGGRMQLTEITDADEKAIYRQPLPAHALAYLDSGDHFMAFIRARGASSGSA